MASARSERDKKWAMERQLLKRFTWAIAAILAVFAAAKKIRRGGGLSAKRRF